MYPKFNIHFAPALLALFFLIAGCTPPAGGAAERTSQLATSGTGIFSNPLAFTSTLEVTEFVVENEQLVAVGFFTVTDFEGNTETVPAATPVQSMSADSSCSELTVILGPLNLQVLGMALNAETLQFVTVANPDKGFNGLLLCGIVDAFNNADMDLVAMMLNEVLALFGWA